MILGILGGIGSGKSTVTRLFAGAGCPVVDADQVAHQVLREASFKDQIRRRFGEEVFSQDQEVDRAALAKKVFGQPQELAALNQIVHPPVRERIAGAVQSHRQRFHRQPGPDRPETILVLDVSLLATSPLREECDQLIFVEASDPLRAQRCQNRGWPAEEMAKREIHQASVAEKRRLAHWIIDNNGSIEQTRQQVLEILQQIISGRLSAGFHK